MNAGEELGGEESEVVHALLDAHADGDAPEGDAPEGGEAGGELTGEEENLLKSLK